ncbi:hypothetical protein BC826DRAFT_1103449 [Russula brevipes]|nr:hypothetical protein BC826DRAFT_1103449 [Russula brevipes]
MSRPCLCWQRPSLGRYHKIEQPSDETGPWTPSSRKNGDFDPAKLLAAEAVLLPAFRAFLEILSPLQPVNSVPRDVLSSVYALSSERGQRLSLNPIRRKNQTISTENLVHAFRLPPPRDRDARHRRDGHAPRNGVVGALSALRDELAVPVPDLLPRLLNLLCPRHWHDALALVRYVGQRLEPGLPDPRIVCPASLKSLLGTRFGEVEAFEDLSASDFPLPLTVPRAMQEFLEADLGRATFAQNEWDWLMERNRWDWN